MSEHDAKGFHSSRALLGLVVMVVALAGACGAHVRTPATPASSPSPPSGIAGRALIGGGPDGIGPFDYAHIAVHQGDVSGPVVATTVADKRGDFKVDVPPGRYVVEVVNKGGGQSLPATVEVEPGAYATARPGLSVR